MQQVLVPKNNDLIQNKLFEKIKEYSHLTAVISDDRVISFDELYKLVESQLPALRKNININTEIVGLRFEDPVKHLVVSLALLRIGVTQCTIDVRLHADTQMDTAQSVGVGFVIQDLSDMPNFANGLMIIDDNFTQRLIHESHISAKDQDEMEDLDSNKQAFVFMGSGTTGKPKAITISFNTLTHMINRDLDIRNLQVGDRHYSITTLDYFTAKRRMWGCLLEGVILIMPVKPPKKVADFCRRFQVDHLSLTTSQAVSMVHDDENPLESYPKLPNLKSMFVGSSPVTESIRQKIHDRLTTQLYVVYGTYEFGEATVKASNNYSSHPDSVGVPCPGVTIDIIDKDGNICTSGEKGRIRLSSDAMTGTYYNNPEASKKAFDKKGFYPGDLGCFTPEGHLVFLGREDDVMIYFSTNIYPREIEQVLESHPNVIESAAFPLTIMDHEGVPFAVVRVQSQVSEKELINLCKKKLGWKSPVRILFSKELPQNKTGKILKRELAKMVESRLNLSRGNIELKNTLIPKIIHQSYLTSNMPKSVNNNIEKLKRVNPNWEHKFYDDDDQIKFIIDHYEPEILKAYNKINPLYGVARTDFFRYLLLYKVGGVWIDIKSTINQDLDTLLQENDSFILSQWQNKMGESSQGWGLSRELTAIPGGEFQQWHIISAPNNPLLKAVILQVLQNINTYTPEKFGIGQNGVWQTTGPIAYTLAIAPLLRKYKHRFIDIRRDFKFQYNIFKKYEHRKLFKTHYTKLKEPVILSR